MNDMDVHPGATRADEARERALDLIGHIGLSLGVDVVLLSLFVAAGTISLRVPLLYGAIIGATLIVLRALLHLPRVRHWRDPGLTRPALLLMSAIELGFSLYSPPMASYFLNLLFLAFAFAALNLDLRGMLSSFVLVALGGIWVRLQLGDALGIPNRTSAEQVLVWLGHASILLRCCVVGWYGNRLQRQLQQRNRELSEAAQEITYLATHDNLTGVLRRIPLWELIGRQPSPPGHCVAMLDLDRFKDVNDRYGHAVGDEALRLFAATVRNAIRPGDALGRYGGEEFLMLLAGTAPAAAVAIAERVRLAVAGADWQRLAPGLRVTVSIGVAAGKPGETVEQLVERADRAVYAAKQAGRNRTVLLRDDGVFEVATPEPATAG
ncbi:GGDEF domain-containing protein [Solimonas variicoloris]|uniref:GGDEF domain-containing protein n=1 Tax=Solimonas variicoloris TaxID=254408 RepID=UPI0003A71ACB|nr:GGDEF domain-containing protein [Solimonas variicoloris]